MKPGWLIVILSLLLCSLLSGCSQKPAVQATPSQYERVVSGRIEGRIEKALWKRSRVSGETSLSLVLQMSEDGFVNSMSVESERASGSLKGALRDAVYALHPFAEYEKIPGDVFDARLHTLHLSIDLPEPPEPAGVDKRDAPENGEQRTEKDIQYKSPSSDFQMIGTIQDSKGKLDVLLNGPNGSTYRVGKGDEFGVDEARVISVKEDEFTYEVTATDGGKSELKKYLYTTCESPKGEDRGLTRHIVRLCMDDMGADLYSIYARELRRNPDARGIVKLYLEISSEGQAMVSVNLEETTAPIPFARKIAERVDHFEFPDSESGFSGPYTINFFPK